MDTLRSICPDCELSITFRPGKIGSTFTCPECSTKLEIVDIDGREAVVDYAEDEEDEL